MSVIPRETSSPSAQDARPPSRVSGPLYGLGLGGFLTLGALLMAGGWALHRSGLREVEARAAR